MTNFEGSYSRPNNEVDLHVVQQRLGESLRSYIQRFSQVRNTIPRISNASIVVTFRQGVRDKKMLVKLATHDVQDVSWLFSLANKCARTVEGRDWHSQPAPEVGKASKHDIDATAQGSDKKKKKTVGSKDKQLASAPNVVATMAGGGCGPRGDKHPRQSSVSDSGGLR
jgi:electron transfer flavoprotein alpha subunit